MEGKAIIKNATRVLTPFEYEKLRIQLNPVYQAICDVLLHTGLRMPEFWDLLRHPEWYDAKRRCIEVPKRTVQKKKLKVVYRQVNLNLLGCEAIEHLFKVNPKHISRQAMTETLCFAARKAELPELDKGVAPKMFRKTIVSWLMKTYPERMFEISASAGHTLDIMKDHYSNLAFAAQDREDIKRFVKGWGEA
jgi:integrase